MGFEEDPRDDAKGITVSDDVELITDRLLLRRPVEADATAIMAIAGDSEVARQVRRVPHPYGPNDFRYFMDHVVRNTPTWAIVNRADSTVVGAIGLVLHADSRSAELGYYVSRAHWGQGFATEAARAVVRFAFDTIGCTKLTAGYFADNPASGRVLEKLGFEPVGRSLESCLAAGTVRPGIAMELCGQKYCN
jgi:RimJ/RimL family protein N-acetyltransferase